LQGIKVFNLFSNPSHQFIQPICLAEKPASDNKYDDRTVQFIGWGGTNGTLKRQTIQIFSQRWVKKNC